MKTTFYFSDSTRGIKVLGVVMIFYILLVATHEGEFWPFSIYPMFSQAGNPWSRALVMDVTDVPDEALWDILRLHDSDPSIIPVGRYGVDQIDFANFISKTEEWTPSRREALLTMFGPDALQGRRWMAASVHGAMDEESSVTILIVPLLLMTEEGVILRPEVPSNQENSEGF